MRTLNTALLLPVVLQALEAVPMPDSTGPIARSDRTVALAPAAPDLPDLQARSTGMDVPDTAGSVPVQPRA